MERASRSSTLSIAGFVVGVAATAIVASVPGSPLQPALPAGVTAGGPFAWLVRIAGVDELHGAALVVASVLCVTGSMAAFVFVMREAWRGTVSVRTVVILAVAAHAVVLTLPLLVSRDVYSYIAYGNIAGLHHVNPYIRTPADFPRDAVASLVGPKWFSTSAVYGPLFTDLAAVVVRTVRGLPAQIDAFRWIAAAASLATVALIATTARRIRPSRAAFAAAAFGLNPVVLFQSVASGHNDLLLAVAVAGAFASVLARRELLAVAVLALATLVKVTAALPLLLLIVWCVARSPSGRRTRTLATHAGTAAAIGALVAAPFLSLHDPTLGALELAGHEGWLAPSRFFRRLLDALSGDTLGIVARVAFAVVLTVCVGGLARTVWRAGRRDDRTGPASAVELGAAWGWSLLLLMLLGPILLPWYVAWALPIAWVLPRTPRGVLLATSVALGVSQWTAEPGRFPGAYDTNVLIGHSAITPVVIALLGWLLLDGWRRWRDGLPANGADPVADPGGEQGGDRGSRAAGER